MTNLLSYTILGIALGAVYAIAASGLVVTYTTSGIFNFAHGAFGMIAAFSFWQLHVGWGWPTWLSMVVVVAVGAPLAGAAVERVVMRGIEGASDVVKVVVTVGLMLGLLGLANIIWPSDVGHPLPNFFAGSKVKIGGVFLTYHRIVIVVAGLAVAFLLRVILRRTRAGVAMRAVVDDRDLVRLNGARPDRLAMLSWALGTALAATAGVLIGAERGSLSAIDLTLMVINAYAAAVFGRLSSLPRTLVGALILGLTEAYVTGYINPNSAPGGFSFVGIRSAVPAVVLFFVLLFLPQDRLRVGTLQRRPERWPMPTVKLAVVGGIALVVVTWALAQLIAPTDLISVENGYFLALVALSLVPLTGFAGQISLAQMTFAGVGGVIAGLLGVSWSPWGVFVAVAVTAALGALVALPALRLTGIYLALSTAAFAMLMSPVFFNQPRIMSGGNRQVPVLQLGSWTVSTRIAQLLVLATTFAVVGVGLVVIRRGAYGRRLAALKDSPVACATLGLDLTRTKVGVFALSAAIAGLAGAVSGRTLVSDQLSLVASLPITMMAVVGGVGAVGGAFVGGLILGAFPIASTVFATNAVGLFRFAEMAIPDVMRIAPGLMGISLGRNPSGAIEPMAEPYRPLRRSPRSLVVLCGGLAGLWVLARTDVVANWTFVAALVVFLAGMVPFLPMVVDGGPSTTRRIATAVVDVALLLVVLGLDWESLIGSNGMRCVAIVVTAGVAAAITTRVSGLAEVLAPEPPESPDLWGLTTALTRSDLIDLDRALGVDEEVLSGAR